MRTDIAIACLSIWLIGSCIMFNNVVLSPLRECERVLPRNLVALLFLPYNSFIGKINKEK